MKYFLGVYDAAGYLSKLSKGLAENGNSVRYLNLAPDRYGYSNYNNYRFAKKLENRALSSRSGSLHRLILSIFVAIFRVIILINEIFRSDVFIFTGFQSFLNFYDLSILKFFGKKVIVIYLGSDARPPYLSGKHLDDNGGFFSNESAFAETKKLKSRIVRVERWADHIINHTATAQFFTKRSIAFSYLGIPFDRSLLAKQPSAKSISESVKILHAPSRPYAKGSNEFRLMVANLKKEGFDIDLIELTNKTNEEVIAAIQNADLILDELYSDMPLATLGIEASLFKKPVIVGGYFSNYVYDVTPKESIPPSLFVAPENIEVSLKKLLNEKELWQSVGVSQWLYVVENYHPSVIAKKVELIVMGAVPDDYTYSPLEMMYFEGWGISAQNLKNQLKGYVGNLGIDALCINHNQALKEKMKQFFQS